MYKSPCRTTRGFFVLSVRSQISADATSKMVNALEEAPDWFTVELRHPQGHLVYPSI